MNIVFKASDNVKEKMIDYYMDKRREKNPPYSIFQAIEADTIITLYESGKVMFQGISADIDANIWMDMEMNLNNRDIRKELDEKENNKKEKEEIDLRYFNYSAIGSDEVGTGDYFLPIVVTATYVSKENIMDLQELKVGDSKKLTDDKIKEIAPIIMKKIPYKSITLTNKEYNNYKEKDINMNKVKAILHNKVLYSLALEGHKYEKVIIDQFTSPRSYFAFIKNEENKITNITFLTKAEDKNLSVACASIISRYIFLEELDKLNKKYKTIIPKGAGIEVDKKGKELVSIYGKEVLNEIAKITFKNTDKILER